MKVTTCAWWIITALIVVLLVVVLLVDKGPPQSRSKTLTKKKNKVVEGFMIHPMTNKRVPSLLCHRETDECSSPHFTHPCCVTNGIEMLADVVKVFQQNHIPLWITGVTLDGYRRCRGFSPKTETIEMASARSPIVSRALEELKQRGYDISRSDDHVTIYYSESNRLPLTVSLVDSHANNLTIVKLYGVSVAAPSFDNQLPIDQPAIPLPLRTIVQSPNDDYGIYACYIINLASRRDRLYHTMAQCDRVGLCGIPVVAVDGKKLSLADLKKRGIYEPSPGYNMKITEIACALSAIKAMRAVAQLPDPDARCLICEDDIIFADDFDRIAREVRRELDHLSWDVVFYGTRDLSLAEMTPVSKHLYKAGLSFGAWAYIITPRSAQKILSRIFPIKYPIDLTITIPHPQFPAEAVYDHRFDGQLERLIVHTGQPTTHCHRCTDDRRRGIINELSMFHWKESTSSNW